MAEFSNTDADDKTLDIDIARNNLAEAVRGLIAIGAGEPSVTIEQIVLEADDSNRRYGYIQFSGDGQIVEAILRGFNDVRMNVYPTNA